ncbi:hypothetical protein AB833_04655 [Chromatiales bacterium (ex Bugula neritina AB1)]|nr:hypothetical protein AB833_04655 [Chromatiales bacterium (ex Bugula neritina AB1)]
MLQIKYTEEQGFMHPVDVKKFVKQSSSVQGWFSSEAAMLFAWVDQIQQSNQISGDCFEIGCHHGKSAMLLGGLVDPATEKLAVCDLFGMQTDNVSRSGNGDLDTFERNMKEAKDAGLTINVFQKNSADLTADEIGRNYRFFHIDGGHNPEEALVDLHLAAECLVDRGVIALDDPFRMEWPGVTEALLRFLDENNEFQAIMVGFNKLLLTRKAWSGLYLKEFEDLSCRETYKLGYPWRVKQLPFHQFDLRIIYVPDYLQKLTPGNIARRIYHKTRRFLATRRQDQAAAKPA